MNESKSGPRIPNANPGFVQNCPTPSVTDFAMLCATAAPRDFNAPGKTKTGLMLPISAKSGIGTVRAAAAIPGTITVTGTGIASVGSQLTISPGGQTVTVDVSLL